MTLTLDRETAEGINFACRPGTSDVMMVHSIIAGDEYHLRDRKVSGWAIDLGAHIGVAAAYLLAQNPDLSVIAVEPVPSNAELCRENLAVFGDRATVIEGAAGSGERTTVWHDYTQVDGYPDAYVHTNRFIGGVWREDPGGGIGTSVPIVSLSGLMTEYGIEELALLKTDCEGGEYAFLSDPAANERVLTIVGEWHDSPNGDQRIRDLLPMHNFVRSEPEPGGITGLFEAELRDLWAEIGR